MTMIVLEALGGGFVVTKTWLQSFVVIELKRRETKDGKCCWWRREPSEILARLDKMHFRLPKKKRFVRNRGATAGLDSDATSCSRTCQKANQRVPTFEPLALLSVWTQSIALGSDELHCEHERGKKVLWCSHGGGSNKWQPLFGIGEKKAKAPTSARCCACG